MNTEMVRPKVRPDLSWSEVDDGGVLFDSNANKIHSLNSTAACIWLLADGSRTAQDIAAELCEICQVPIHKVLADVEDTLNKFRRENLLASDHGTS